MTLTNELLIKVYKKKIRDIMDYKQATYDSKLAHIAELVVDAIDKLNRYKVVNYPAAHNLFAVKDNETGNYLYINLYAIECNNYIIEKLL